MADTKIIGTAYGWVSWGFNGNDGGPNADIGNLFRNMLPQAYVDLTLDADSLPQLGGTSGALIRTAGAETFAQWFRDTQPAEKVEDVELTLTGTPGKYLREYSTCNAATLGLTTFCWTFKSNVQGFQYAAGQYIKVKSGGSTEDVFVYVAGQRLPGLFGQADDWQTASLDGLGLTVGEFYPIQFFFMYRDPGGGGGTLGVETNFALEEEYVVAISQWVLGSGTMVPAAGAYAPGLKTVTATPTEGYVLTSLTANGVAITSGAAYDFQVHTVLAALFTFTSDNTAACTRDNIIAAALRKCQVLAEGELPTTDQITTGASALERFMKHMQADTEFRWLFLDRTETIVSGTQTYTLTGSGDVLDIYNLFLRDASGQDIPLRTVDSNWYDQTLMSKANSDAQPAVAVVAFNRAYSTNTASVTVTIYPKPSAAYTLHYKAMTKFYNLVGGASELIQDEIWCDVVVYGLAARLADEYLGVERSAYLEQKFEKLKDEAKRKSTASRDTMMVYSV